MDDPAKVADMSTTQSDEPAIKELALMGPESPTVMVVRSLGEVVIHLYGYPFVRVARRERRVTVQ